MRAEDSGFRLRVLGFRALVGESSRQEHGRGKIDWGYIGRLQIQGCRGFRFLGMGIRIQGAGLAVQGLQDCGSGLEVSGSGLWGFGVLGQDVYLA